MQEPYNYSLQDAPSGGPYNGSRAGAGEASEASARLAHFFRQLALLLVLNWVVSLVGRPLLSEISFQIWQIGLWGLGSFLDRMLPPLAGLLLALLLFSRAAVRPVPARRLLLCLLFEVCAQLLILEALGLLPWQLCTLQFFSVGAAGWIGGALAAAPEALGRKQARQLALALFGAFCAARLVSVGMEWLLYQLMMSTGYWLLVQWLVGLANLLLGLLILAACFALVRHALDLPRGALLPGAKNILLFLLCSLALAGFCWLKAAWRPYALMEGMPGTIMGYLGAMTAQPASPDVLRLSLLVQGAAMLWYGAMRTPLPPPGLPRGARGRQLNALSERAEAGDPDAQFELVCCYAQGIGGVRHDPEKAARLWRAAAENGSEAARLALLELGHGQDRPAAPPPADEPPQYAPKYTLKP